MIKYQTSLSLRSPHTTSFVLLIQRAVRRFISFLSELNFIVFFSMRNICHNDHTGKVDNTFVYHVVKGQVFKRFFAFSEFNFMLNLI